MNKDEINAFIDQMYANGKTATDSFGVSWDELSTLEFIAPETTVRNPEPYRVIEFEFDNKVTVDFAESFRDNIVYNQWDIDDLILEKITYWYTDYHIMGNNLFIKFEGNIIDSIFDCFMKMVKEYAPNSKLHQNNS